MMKSKALIASVAAMTMSQAGAAQSLRDFQFEGQNEVRATASITIPLGAPRGIEQSTPRLDFGFDNQIVTRVDDPVTNRFDPSLQERQRNASRVSLTLENNPRLLLNENQVATFGPRIMFDEDERRDGISTGEGIAIGLGLLGGLILISTLELADEIEDLGEED